MANLLPYRVCEINIFSNTSSPSTEMLLQGAQKSFTNSLSQLIIYYYHLQVVWGPFIFVRERRGGGVGLVGFENLNLDLRSTI